MFSTKNYRILWIDDQHEELSGIIAEARLEGITLHPYKSLDGGMTELKKNYSYYDGVLLDAKFYEFEADKAGSEDTYNVHRAKEVILGLPKKFEVFVLTGQAEAYNDQTFNKAFRKVYEKGAVESVQQLFIDIKAAADKQEDTQLRHQHQRVFDCCTKEYFGTAIEQDLLYLLKCENLEGNQQFNTIRRIVEQVFRKLIAKGLVSKELLRDGEQVKLTPTSKFLCGWNEKETKEHLYSRAPVPTVVANYLKSILHTTQNGSHQGTIIKHVKKQQSPYLFQSTLYQLLDLLLWFKQYLDTEPKTEDWYRF